MLLPAFSDSHVHYRNAEAFIADLPEMKKIGLKKIAFMALSLRPWGFSGTENLDAIYMKKSETDVPVYTFGSLSYDYFLPFLPYEKQAELLLSLGFDGMKFIEMKPTYRRLLGYGLNHPRYNKMFAYLEKSKAPVVIHACDPCEWWTNSNAFKNQQKQGLWYGDGTLPSKEEMNREIFDILDKYPDLNVVLAHMFFLSHDIDEAIRVLEKYPNVKFDLTPNPGMYRDFSRNIEAWREFFIKYRDRILYGTDNNEKFEGRFERHEFISTALTHDHSEYMTPYFYTPIRGLNLDEEAANIIAVKNFDRYFGNEPKQINEQLLSEVKEKLCEHLESIPQAQIDRTVHLNYLDKLKSL